jgi:cytochrome c oxidase assembly protein subunit 11
MLVFYRATNTTDRKITGTATFNVAPDAAGLYFSKIECFCFKEQTLEPGQSIEMPVSFYVDPALVKDPESSRLKEITLSYTFYPVEGGKAEGQASIGTVKENRS